MFTIILQQKSTGKKIAMGVLDQSVWKIEKNYYFDESGVNLDILSKKLKTYTCPIKRSVCDYYYLKSDLSQEIGWCYENILHPSFKKLNGKIGFFGLGRDLEIIEEPTEE